MDLVCGGGTTGRAADAGGAGQTHFQERRGFAAGPYPAMYDRVLPGVSDDGGDVALTAAAADAFWTSPTSPLKCAVFLDHPWLDA